MADFVQQSNVKSATRELAAPIADVATFAGIIQGILDTNQFRCTAYETSSQVLEDETRAMDYTGPFTRRAGIPASTGGRSRGRENRDLHDHGPFGMVRDRVRPGEILGKDGGLTMFRLSTRRKMVIAGCVLIALAAGLACNDQPQAELVENGDVGVVEGDGGEVGGELSPCPGKGLGPTSGIHIP